MTDYREAKKFASIYRFAGIHTGNVQFALMLREDQPDMDPNHWIDIPEGACVIRCDRDGYHGWLKKIGNGSIWSPLSQKQADMLGVLAYPFLEGE